MAEERIFITTRHKDEKLNMTFTDMCKEYTRQEAIEKMAKAICKSDGICKYYACGNCTEWLGNDSEAAEAALNALLGE